MTEPDMRFLDSSDRNSFSARPDGPPDVATCIRPDTTDSDVDYALEVNRGFEALKYAAALLTGTLLLDLTGSDRTVQDRALADKACDALTEARDAVLSARPRSINARHHNYHLRAALEHLVAAADIASHRAELIAGPDADTIYAAIYAAWDELKKLDGLMAGFQMVDLTQSCCAFHARQMTRLAQ